MESLFNLEFVIRLLIALVLGFSLGLDFHLSQTPLVCFRFRLSLYKLLVI